MSLSRIAAQKPVALKLRVINLARSPERMARFAAQNPGLAAERSPAVDGAAIDRAACIRDGIIAAANAYRPGALGCALSHIALWRQCAAGTEAFHVSEDDVVFRHDFSTVAAALLAGLPEWDIVLWAHNLDWPVQIEPAPGTGVVVVQYDHEATAPDKFRSGTTVPLLAPLVSAAGTPCYSVSPRGAARMLAGCLPIGNVSARYLHKLDTAWYNTGIDVELCRHYADWRAFVALPFLAMADNDQSASTIRGHLQALHDPRIANRAPAG
jgi:glycosyl transferase family 25